MSTRFQRVSRFGLVLALLLMLIGGLVPTAAQEGDGGPVRVGLRPDAPAYAVHGPYWVGMKEAVIDPGAERPLPVRVWYPALNPTGAEEVIDYPTDVQFFEVPEGVPSITRGHALADAAPATSDAPYPLVVYSHGFSANREQGAFLTESLASYGFVVIALTHPGEVWGKWWETDLLRPGDVSRVIDFAESLTLAEGAFEGLIDVDSVGLAGWSSGGFAALAVAGARMDQAHFETWCKEHSDSPDAVENCPGLLANEDLMLSQLGISGKPDGLWPSQRDPRVDAIIAYAGTAFVFGPEGLATIDIPVMVQVGTLDTSLTPEWNASLTYANVSSSQKALVTFQNGSHMIFGGSCADNPWFVGTDPSLYWVCSDAVWDIDRAHDLINHFTTAFLLDVLKGDAEAHAALLPDAVSFPGITYETTMR